MNSIEYNEMFENIKNNIKSINKFIDSDENNEYSDEFKEYCYIIKSHLEKFIFKFYKNKEE